MDLSKLSNEELLALHKQSSQSSSTDLSKMSNDDLLALHKQMTAQAAPAAAPAKSMSQVPEGESFATSPGAAAIAGASNAGANLIEGTVDAGAWILDHLGASKFADQMKKHVRDDMDKLFRSSERTDANDTFEKAREAHPAISAVTQAGTEVGALSKLFPASTPAPAGAGVLGKLGNFAKNSAIQGSASALVNAGMAGPNTADQDTAAKVGFFLPAAVNAAGATIKSATKIPFVKDKLKSIVDVMSKPLLASNMNLTDKAAESITNFANKADEVGNSNWDSIKSIPGTINSSPIDKTISGIKSKYGEKLDPKLANVLDDISDRAGQMKTMDDAIKLKQMISRQSKNFRVGNVSDDLADSYKSLRTNVDKAIEAKAASVGKGSDWTLANKYHREVIVPLDDAGAFDISKAFQNRETNPSEYNRAVKSLLTNLTPQKTKALLSTMDDSGSKILEQNIVKTIFDDISINPEQFSPNEALIKLNRSIAKYDGILRKDSINTLKGIKKLMQDAGIRGVTAKGGIINLRTSLQFGAGGLGAAVGSMAGGPAGGAAGSLAAFAITPTILRGIDHMINSPIGLSIIRGIGEGKPWTKEVSNLLKAGLTDTNAKLNKSE